MAGRSWRPAISEDGNTIAVGAGDEACLTPGIDPPGCADVAPPGRGANIWVGAAYVFVRNGTPWTEQVFIKAPNARPYSSFGEVLASLTHPRIGAIYLEESNVVRALVLELVEGPTLAERIADGPFPLDQALPTATQIADALEAAHERGVIHRDLAGVTPL